MNMKTVVVHSFKGGVGKTTAALLLSKYAVLKGHQVCVIDFDFIGSGMAHLFHLEKHPKLYLEEFLTKANPENCSVDDLMGCYFDQDLPGRRMGVILNSGGEREEEETSEGTSLPDDRTGLMATESKFGDINNGTSVLLDKLDQKQIQLTVIDCHPGLEFVSASLRPLAHLNLYVTTPNRSDCYGLLAFVNRRKDEIDRKNTFLLYNQAPQATELRSFQQYLEDDNVVGRDAQRLLPQLVHVGKDEERFAALPETQGFRQLYYLKSRRGLPRMARDEPESRFCEKVLRHVLDA